MKKLVLFMLIAASITICGCDNKTSIDSSNRNSGMRQAATLKIKTNEQTNNRPADKTSENSNSTQTVNSAKKDIEPIKVSDFIISDGIDSIKLDSPFKEFKYHKPEEKIDNNYVGETTSGEYTYKTYMHKYPDFDLYVSNLNYNLKNRNFDEYYITQITLNNSNFKTARGIAIGSKLENVYNAYGSTEMSNSDGIVDISYGFEDMELLFAIDKKNQNVKEIVLMIKPENTN
ncbi:hypothetical protein [Ruminiclostridium cellulolyticum]|uniref:Lipoprotein n=1 Tax=Ruminiclostridium cellulolyticum (strain ATCC 35319 / DSM 5812 / JCM 6584 / H10) TaxID=394503 RepID=B8I2C2_RUMCH|nr:hypothetical protein [Ruminiclostridium cellulolyticum]ACL75915.1 hypothetical protein Ccel_1563 [Ruminiclostridium cellulolyticum H10]